MKRHVTLFAAVALVLAGLDLLTKGIVFHRLPEHGETPVIREFFSIGCEFNPGVIWSFGQKAKWLWLVVSVLAIPLIAWIFVRSRKTWTATICLGMIEAGTIGNCVDRVFYGAVRDFIKFYNLPRIGTWPLFNIADSCIVVGVILLSIEMYFFDEKKAAKPIPPPAPAPPNPKPPAP